MIKIIDSVVWATATVFLFYSGIYYTYKLKFIQFNFLDMFKSLFKKQKSTITPFQSLMLVLGGRIGVGSIAGIALSIYLGGIGSIFWIWIAGIISAPNTFAETVLGCKYHEKDNDAYKGGPSYYLKNGLFLPKLGRIYAIIMVVSQIGGCLSIQSNTLVKSLKNVIPVSPVIIGVVIGFLFLNIVLGGIKKISNTATKLVPIMTVLYILIAFLILIKNIHMIPSLLLQILTSAFNFKALGFGLFGTIIIGIQRGIFSNEAGLGTGAIAASTVDIDYPAKQGFVQMIGIYITTFLVCTSTAIIILTSNVSFNLENVNGIEIAQEALIYHLGNLGNILLIICIILFCFSSILACYYDGESSYKYLKNNKNNKVLKIISFIILIIGGITSSELLWQIVNIFTAILAIINVYALLKLKEDVILEWKRYNKCAKMK